MIERQTVVVLGAGASMPYGMPSGAQLRDEICREASSPNSISSTLETMLDIDVDETSAFAKAFSRSSIASIDAFLAKRNHFVELGKLCIAASLCARETSESVLRIDNEDHWYRHLWNVLIEDAHSVADIGRNKIKFITFNYDRSLEYFLHTATKNTYGVNDNDAAAALERLEILHVYGSLGKFHHSGNSESRVYADRVNPGLLRIAANGISIIPETRDKDNKFMHARDLFSRADVIAFLGFGFDSLNIERLGLESVLQWRIDNKKPEPTIFASTFGMTESEIERARMKICPARPWESISEKNLMAIRRTGMFG